VHLAAKNGHLDVVQWMVRKGGWDVECTGCSEQTLLLCAGRSNRVAIVQWLVREGGANIYAKDQWGYSIWSYMEDLLAATQQPELLLKTLFFSGPPPPWFGHRQLVAQSAELRAALPQFPAEQARLLRASAFGQAIPVPALVQLVARLARPSFDDAWELAERGCFAPAPAP
jgi:hypothetical protein